MNFLFFSLLSFLQIPPWVMAICRARALALSAKRETRVYARRVRINIYMLLKYFTLYLYISGCAFGHVDVDFGSAHRSEESKLKASSVHRSVHDEARRALFHHTRSGWVVVR